MRAETKSPSDCARAAATKLRAGDRRRAVAALRDDGVERARIRDFVERRIARMRLSPFGKH